MSAHRLFGRKSGRSVAALASAARAAPLASGPVHLGSAAPGSGSAAAHSFGLGNAAFAPIAPPDILDLDAWMDREKWNLGRLSSRPYDDPRAVTKRLDSLIAQEENLNHTVQAIIVRSGYPFATWNTLVVAPGYTEVHMPHDAWLSILRHLNNEWQRAGGDRAHSRGAPPPSVSYKGIPVTVAPF